MVDLIYISLKILIKVLPLQPKKVNKNSIYESGMNSTKTQQIIGQFLIKSTKHHSFVEVVGFVKKFLENQGQK